MDTLQIQPTQWGSIPDVNDIEPVREGDRACLADVRDVLKKHNALDRFGIMLIHKHFDLADDEILVEMIDTENRILTTMPRKRSEVGEAIETQWTLVEGEAMALCDRQCIYRDYQHYAQHHARPW